MAATTLAVALGACTSGAPEARAPAGAQGDGPATATPEDARTTTGQDRAVATRQPAPSGGTAAVPEGLEEFYGQQIEWTDCDGNECGTLTVPVDYAEPDGPTIELALLRVPAEGEPQGSLVVNPGGPGASGVEYASLSGLVLSAEVSDAYDVVGFDPRGVAGSAPITCVEDEQLDQMLGADPTPDDAAEEQRVTALMQDFVAGCQERAADLLGHVSTVEVARDLDVLRAALGEDRLDYLGASYGTLIGATYAELFPERVGRLVLDGAMDPTLTGLEMGLGQAEGFQRAATAYAQNCVDAGDCPLGETPEAVLQTIEDFLEGLDEDPIPVQGDTVTELTEGWGVLGVIVAMYDQAGWPLLTSALSQGLQGDGTMLMMLANLYASRSADGSYDGNGMQAIYAVNCLDRPASGDVDEEAALRQFEQVAPTFGKYLAGEGMCQHWPVEAQTVLEDYDGAGADPILVIGTTRDPATPYEWAQGLAKVLDSGVLISYDGDGHTAYGRSNDCVDDAVDAYLLEGIVPQDGLSC